MKKFLSVLLLGLLMGAVSYPILFSEAKAQSESKDKEEFNCPNGNLPPIMWTEEGVNCLGMGSGCTVVTCDGGPVITPEK